MAQSGYAGEVSNTYDLRFKWTSNYNPATNKSTISIMPQESGGGNFGGDMLGTGYGISDSAGVYINGVRKYALDGSYGGNYKNLSNAAADWYHDFEPTVGSIGTAEVTHGSDGYATFTARVYCVIFPYNYPSAGSYRKTLDTGTVTVRIHEDAPYKITYNANGGSGAPSAQDVYANIQYTLSNTRPTRTGYTFLGWSTNSAASTATYQPGASITPTGNVVLYAIWTKNSYTLTISGDAHSTIVVKRGSTVLNNGATIYYGDVLAISITAATGYQIETRSPLNDSVTVSSNLTVSATTSPMATIHRRTSGAWNLYLIYVRRSGAWFLHQANIRKNGSWLKYF